VRSGFAPAIFAASLGLTALCAQPTYANAVYTLNPGAGVKLSNTTQSHSNVSTRVQVTVTPNRSGTNIATGHAATLRHPSTTLTTSSRSASSVRGRTGQTTVASNTRATSIRRSQSQRPTRRLVVGPAFGSPSTFYTSPSSGGCAGCGSGGSTGKPSPVVIGLNDPGIKGSFGTGLPAGVGTGSLNLDPTPSAPEPLTLALFGAGLAGAVAMRRRGKQSA